MKSRGDLSLGRFGTPYTTNYIIDETITLLRIKAGFESSLKFKEKLEKTRVLGVVWVQAELVAQANHIFRAYPRLKLSFTDCTSIAVMRQLGIKKALTFDGDFRVAGFQTVP